MPVEDDVEWLVAETSELKVGNCDDSIIQKLEFDKEIAIFSSNLADASICCAFSTQIC